MDLRSRLDRLKNRSRPAADWLRTLARNGYFWSGLAVLLLLVVGAYVLFNNVLMPTYTRYGVTTTVPDVVGVSFEQARRTLHRQGFAVEKSIREYNSNFPKQAVTEQSPPPHAVVKPGRRIYLRVNSSERPMVRVPPLKGASVREAKNRLQAVGLEVTDLRLDSIPSPYANTITDMKPAPGDSLPRGTGVILWYSDGNRDAPYVTVPKVAGLLAGAARDSLLNHRLRSVLIDPGEEQDNAADSLQTVQRQRPQPGTRVRAGSEIRLIVE